MEQEEAGADRVALRVADAGRSAHRPRPPAVPAALRAPGADQPPAHPTRLQSSRHRRRPPPHPHPPGGAGPLPTPPRHRLRPLPLRPGPPRRRHPGRRTTRHRGRARLPTRHHPGHRPLPAAARDRGRQQLLHRPHRLMPATIPTPSWPAGCPSGTATTSGAGSSSRTGSAAGATTTPPWSSSSNTATRSGSATSSPPWPATTPSLRPLPSWPPTCWWCSPAPSRETELHRAVPPRSYLLATATPPPDSNPADAIWLPLGSTGPRQRLSRPRPPSPPGIGSAMNPAPAAPQAACWDTDGPTRLPVEEARQRRLTVLLPEDPPLVTGPVAAVLLRILMETAKSHDGPRDHGR